LPACSSAHTSFFRSLGALPDLHSFPTRRSSDLFAGAGDLAAQVNTLYQQWRQVRQRLEDRESRAEELEARRVLLQFQLEELETLDRKSTRLNSSHVKISYAVFCLKKKKDTAVQR